MSKTTGQPAPAGELVTSTAEKDLDTNVDDNGCLLSASQKGNDVTKKGDDVKQANVHEEEGLVSDSLRSPMQTRVRRISAELRLSASSNFDNIKKAGKGLCNAANKLPLPVMPKSLRRRSWHYEKAEENSLLDTETTTKEDGDDAKLGSAKSKSSENLRKTKDEKDTGEARAAGERSFLMRKWDARKNRDQENKGDEKTGKKVESVPVAEAEITSNQGNEVLSVDTIPIVFEPLMLGQRPLTPTVTISFDEDPAKNNTNPFLD